MNKQLTFFKKYNIFFKNNQFPNLQKLKDRAHKELEIKIQWKIKQREKKADKISNKKSKSRNYDMELANQIEINDNLATEPTDHDNKIIELDENPTFSRKK